MRPGATPDVQDFRLFQQSTLASLEDQPSGAFAGTSKYGVHCWVAQGSQLEVLDLASLKRRAAWQFGRTLDDQNTTITCVEEICLKDDGCLKLMVGISNSTQNGLLCMFDVNTQMIERCIEIPHPVTAVEIICTCMGDSIPRWAFSEQLRYFCGVVAVGCGSGHSFLIDLRLDDKENISNEIEPCKLQFISPRNRDVESQRIQCLMKGLHLCIPINDSLFTSNGFEYRKPDGLVMKTFRLDQVTVTCLTYIHQTGILAIGYNFGCYQLWKLHVPVLEYSSRLESDPMPVTHIAHQEPENDPKSFCYLWVARSQLDPEEEYANSVATVSLYQLSFGHMTFYSGYGVFYDELTSICLRLDHELTSQPLQYGSNYTGTSRILACKTLTDPHYQPPIRLTDDSFDENNHGPDQSLCVFVWEATRGPTTGRHLAIFDINRWYHAQMPSTVRYVSSSIDTCSYMCFYELNDVKGSMGENLLAVYIDTNRLQRFHSNSPLPPEQHFYPSSLEFDATMVFDSGTVKTKFLGDQGQILYNLRKKGPLVMVHPQELYNMSVYLGLLARPIELVSTNIDTGYQRESLLSLALDYEILPLFKGCIEEWASGEYLHKDCSLKFLLDWSWQKVSTIKHQIDTTCVNLFNWSGLFLDQRGSKTLYQCERKLSHLVSIFKLFTSQTVPITAQGEFEIQSKVFVTGLIAQHLSIMLWFVSVGLLPENDDTEVMTGFRYAYPVTSLMSAYKARRTELQKFNSGSELLMIDGLVEACEGVADLWDREGGNGQYPPPSLHAVLSTSLLENIDMPTKHCLILYLLLDLVSMETPEDTVAFSDKIVGYTRRYNLSQTLVKKVQAFWLLDHKDFEEAMTLLEGQQMTADFTHWQHRCIVKSLFCQGEVKLAQRYLYITNPPMYTLEDIKLKLDVLLYNGFVTEALAYQRKTSTKSNTKDLLTHLFYGCQQTKTVDRLLGQLGCDEEKMLEEHLEGSDPLSMDVLVMYYLQASRIVEAFQLNEKLKQYTLTEASSKARERASARNSIVDRYIAVFPDIQRKLLFEQTHVPKRNTHWRRVVRRPTPLSTNVTKSKASVMTQSTYIMKIMEKIDEIENQDQDKSPDRSLNQTVGAFLCTPVVPSRKSFIQSPTTVFLDTEDDNIMNESFTPFPKFFGTPSGSAKRESRFFSASCLTLLQTPKVKKITPEKERKLSTTMVTPQSILKVRNLVNITSPSPHSGGNTPSSQEAGTSVKMPRKLGYSSQSGTPKSVVKGDAGLSSIPRHLMLEVQTASQPTTPKSVSFVEPSSPEDTPPVRSPLQKQSSVITTPKGVSFGERSIMSVFQLKPLVTPKRTEKKVSLVSPPASKRLSPESVTPPKTEGSPREWSKTPESDHSPNSDQLCRRSIHDHSPNTGAPENNLVLKLEESDEDVSDEDVEMETSPKAALNNSNLDMSVTSTMSAESVIEVKSRTNPNLDKNSVIDREAIVPDSDKDLNSSVGKDQMESISHEVDISTNQTESVDISEQESMDIDQKGILLSKNNEIFSVNEELQPGPSSDKSATADTLDTVTSSNDVVNEEPVTVKQEVEEIYEDPPILVRELCPPSVVSPQVSPAKVEIKDSPPSSEYSISTTLPVVGTSETFQEDFIKEIDSVFGDSPVMKEDMKEPLAGTSGISTRKSTVSGKFKFMDMIDEKVSDDLVKAEVESKGRLTPTRSSRRNRNSESFVAEPLTPTRSSRRIRDSVSPAIEAKEPLTPTRSSRRKRDSESSVIEAKEHLTPTRSSRRIRDSVSPKVEAKETLTPTRSARRKRDSESPVIEAKEPLTPTRSSRRVRKDQEGPVTPTRASQRKVKKGENIAVISVDSPKSFSRRAQEAVQESLINLSSEIKSVNEASPTEMTKIRDKPGSLDSPSRTPTRSSQRVKVEAHSEENQNPEKITPSRSRKGAKVTETETEEGENTVKAVTPTRGRKKNDSVKETRSPGRNKNSNNSEKALTPSRRQRKKVEEIDTDAKNSDETTETVQTDFDICLTEIPDDIPEMVSRSPSRRASLGRSCKDSKDFAGEEQTLPSGRESIGKSEIPEDYVEQEDTSKSPSRRKSLSRASKDMAELAILTLTPTRRRSLGRSSKKTVEETSPERGSLATEVADQIEIEVKHTPTRRGRPKKGEQTDKEATNKKDAEPKTPTRRGRGKKLAEVEEKEAEQKAESSVVETPSKRKRVKKDEKKEGSPSRHTRSHDDRTQMPEIFDIQSSSYQFSNPMEVDNMEASQPQKAFTPVKSFLFSPPIQHAKSRLEGEEQPEDNAQPELDEMKVKDESKKPARKSRMKKLYKEADEVLLISPITNKEDSDAGEEGLGIVTRAGTRKVDVKKDGTKSAVQGIVSKLGRPKRTSHRTGPLGQKKK